MVTYKTLGTPPLLQEWRRCLWGHHLDDADVLHAAGLRGRGAAAAEHGASERASLAESQSQSLGRRLRSRGSARLASLF